MRRTLVALSLALLAAVLPFERRAQAAEGGVQFVPYTFETVSLAKYEAEDHPAFLPSKGVQKYEGREMLPGGYTKPPVTEYFVNRGSGDSVDGTKSMFALIELKITNFDRTRPFKVFRAADFYLESPRGATYYPHPFTTATTQRLARPGEAVALTLGFDVPQGSYTLLFREQDPGGKTVLVEIWRFDITIDSGPLVIVGRLVKTLSKLIEVPFVLLDGLLAK